MKGSPTHEPRALERFLAKTDLNTLRRLKADLRNDIAMAERHLTELQRELDLVEAAVNKRSRPTSLNSGAQAKD